MDKDTVREVLDTMNRIEGNVYQDHFDYWTRLREELTKKVVEYEVVAVKTEWAVGEGNNVVHITHHMTAKEASDKVLKLRNQAPKNLNMLYGSESWLYYFRKVNK